VQVWCTDIYDCMLALTNARKLRGKILRQVFRCETLSMKAVCLGFLEREKK